MEEALRVIIREAKAGSDHAFLFSTWRDSIWFAEKRDRQDSDAFYRQASKDIAQILRTAQVRIACLESDPDLFLGWAVLTDRRLEFVYVKIDYRRKGIAKLLTKGFETFTEPKTKIGKILASQMREKSPIGETHGRKEEAKTEPA